MAIGAVRERFENLLDELDIDVARHVVGDSEQAMETSQRLLAAYCNRNTTQNLPLIFRLSFPSSL